ncbi:hypothetical protein [Pseudosulfitobacter koreensis]|uniref:YdhG-like domain-containing protein n=1 Tax=Pseudosulfitobacter koreensis TaxID=2968472 RepID=A0ABT1Z040_9RHOB|nr:hypothetical protein [Pseudosulfitobacter koreense]MCR8826503.1 hypothetical protein [Pseudosulfitobacter koreense]
MDPFNQITGRWPDAARARFDALRAIILAAARDAGVGPLTESLKWGQPAWRPARPRTGSTLRLNWSSEAPDRLCVFVDCKTDLAQRMRDLYPDIAGDGRRVLHLGLDAAADTDAIAHLAAMTFTYHRQSR